MKRKTIPALCIVLALAVVSSVFAGGGAQSDGSGGSRTFRLGHQAPAGTAYDILSQKFKEYVETRSNGRYKIEVYSGATLGNDRVLSESIIAGTVDFAVLTASDMSNFAKELEVQDLPFLFSSWDEVFKFLKSNFAAEFYAITDSAGIKILAFMPRGFRHATNNKAPITKPSDFQGMKLRVVDSAIYVDTFAALGANPQAMAWGEVYTALQQGTVDGHENTIVTINDYKINEVQKYLSKTGHIFAFAAIVINPALLSGLPAADQDLIRKAAVDAALDVGAEQLDTENKAAANLQSKGMQINEVPDKQPFVDKMGTVYDSFFKTHNRKYFDGIKAAVK
ncbi:MAG: TRAP transporter substrate-binding protein [Treponema sp.]|jgi:tripartite ATP-independent transporter DctP family solute receptor|nr:TRAP transporter substrate-binding protein [Treponema sp.]